MSGWLAAIADFIEAKIIVILAAIGGGIVRVVLREETSLGKGIATITVAIIIAVLGAEHAARISGALSETAWSAILALVGETVARRALHYVETANLGQFLRGGK